MTLDRRTFLALGAALVVIVAAALFWFNGAGAAGSENTLTITSGDAVHTFEIELVDTAESRAQGLMFRDELAPDAGMLFDFFEERPVAFWMQNTLIPLDMLFIRADGTIARVHANAVPLDTTAIPSGEPVRFVLEIPGGRAAELGIEAGDTMQHPRVGQD